MASRYTVEDVLAYVDLPMLEEDDMSEDEFEGYISDEEEREGPGDDDTRGMIEDGCSSLGHGDSSTDIPAYTRQEGPTSSLDNLSPFDIFSLVVDEGMLSNIVSQTTLYARQFIDSADLRPHSRVHQWGRVDFSLSELQSFWRLCW